jgi:general secretion pathway protein K
MRQELTRDHAEHGLALVTVLWFLVAMSGLAVAVAEIGRDSAIFGRNTIASIETRTAMAGAVDIVASSLRRGRFPSSGRLSWRQGRLMVNVAAVAEGRKIDINAASDDLIEGLAGAAMAAEDRSPADGLALAHAILDWRDANQDRRLAGAEASDYSGPGGPRDGPFAFLAELRSVRGVDRELFARLASAVTVHPGNEEPSVSLVSALVLDALDRARGLDPNASDNQEASDSPAQPLDDTGDAEGIAIFTTDPRGLYTLDIEVIHESGPRFRQETVIWIDPSLGGREFAILENRSGMLPESALQAIAAGEVPWPEL